VGRTILKEILKEFRVSVWTGLKPILLRIICGDTETSGCMKWEKLFFEATDSFSRGNLSMNRNKKEKEE
jgi:hypothetical protein